MATTSEVVRALTAAAESLLGKELTRPEQTQLLSIFANATGTDAERALKAIRLFTNLTDDQLQVQLGSSDDTNRKMEELSQAIETWKKTI